MNTSEVIQIAAKHLQGLEGHIFEVLALEKPQSLASATYLAKVVSKLSPLVGNLIEFSSCDYLNSINYLAKFGRWRRQDPGFPDTIFEGTVCPTPGFEFKAWFPLATEITARFKDSQNHFIDDQTYVAMLAWLPEYLIFGRVKIIGVVVASGASIARARDNHYHNPPDYLVLEPEDTTARTNNLQQTNTSGYKFQGEPTEFKEAQDIVNGWGPRDRLYRPTPEYQAKLRRLISRFKYRLDTNFAKMDRIIHPDIEAFKNRIHNVSVHGRKVGDWNKLLSKGQQSKIEETLEKLFDIRK